MAFMSTVEKKTKHMRQENMIPGHLKMGEHQAKCGALLGREEKEPLT